MSSLTKSLRSVGSTLYSGVRAVALAPLMVARFAGAQAAGTWRNFRGFVGWLSIDNSLPPAIASTINWSLETVPKALGIRSSSYQQTAAAGVLIMVAVGSAVLTLGLTAAVVVALAPLFVLGIWRFIPAFNTVWQDQVQSRGKDLPRWDR
ncbi:hypothetical protein [Natrinema sp. DC36]|uniref:hypothetical protein n=1 Tax=Natrinema sp. DC36 TaxID=2878680 RepID=UPI001CF0C025|nr:hypothetical protein [Natrinema sp. DC36]